MTETVETRPRQPVDRDGLETTAEPVTETVETTAEPVTETVEKTAEPVTETVDRTLEPVTQTVDKTLEPVTDTVDRTLEPVTDTVDRILKPVTEAVDKALDPVVDTVGHAVDNTVDHVTDTGGTGPASGGTTSPIPEPNGDGRGEEKGPVTRGTAGQQRVPFKTARPEIDAPRSADGVDPTSTLAAPIEVPAADPNGDTGGPVPALPTMPVPNAIGTTAGSSSAGAGSGGLLLIFAAVPAAAMLLAPRLNRWLRFGSESRGPAPFVSFEERPG